MLGLILVAGTFLVVFALVALGGWIMSQLDDIKAELADIKANQEVAATAAADLSDDADKLLALVQSGADLTEIEASLKDIQATAKAQADALTAAAAKFPPTT